MKNYSFRFIFIVLLPTFSFAQQNRTDSLLNIVSRHTQDSTEVRTLYWLGFESSKKDTPKALHYYKEAVRISEQYAPGPWGGTAYLKLASLQSSLGQNDSAQFSIDKAQQICKRYPQDMKLRNDFYSTAGVFSKSRGHYDEALKYLQQVNISGESKGSKEGLAGNYLNISNVYHAMGKHSLTQEFLFKALAIFEEVKNETGISFCYNGLGNEFYIQKKYGKAEEYLQKSLALKEKSKNNKAIVTGLNGLSNLYMDLKKYPEALKNINRAISIAEELGLKDRLCESLINKGMILFQQGNQPEALVCFLKAKGLAEELQNKNYLAYVNTELGRVHQQRFESKEALASLLLSVKQAKQVKSLGAEEAAHHLLADYYYRNHQFEEAYNEYLLFHSLYDTAASTSVKMQLYDLEAKYETHKKESEITLLKKDQQLQAIALRQQTTFQTAILVTLALVVVMSILFFNWYRIINKTKRQLEIERMRNHIAQDLHDDIGSTLSSINIISRMASRQPAIEYATSNFVQIEDYSSKMLSQMADIIWSINPGNDTVNEVLLHMKEFAAEILEPQNIEYHFHESGKAEDLKIDAGIRKNIFLIYKEALNNAMKYSHCTMIKIALTRTPSRLTLDIEDNGNGFSMESVKLGNGLNNMQERAKLMKGNLDIKTAKGEGTRISIAVDIA